MSQDTVSQFLPPGQLLSPKPNTHPTFAIVMLYLTSCSHFCNKVTSETDEENGLKLSMMMKNFQRGRIYQSLSAGQGRRDVPCSQQQSMRYGHFRQLQQYCTQKAENKGGKAELPPMCRQCSLWNAKDESFSCCRSYFSHDSRVGCGGLPADTPVQEKTLLVSRVTCNPWLTPARQAYHQRPYSPHNLFCSSLPSFPWHENTTEEGAPSAPAADGWTGSRCPEAVRVSWGAASPIRPNRHSPAARCTEDIHNMDGAEGRGVTGIAFTAFFQCSPQSPCIPSNEFFANKSKHHKQTHEPTLILSHLSPLLASSFPGERIFTKHSKFPFQLIFIILLPGVHIPRYQNTVKLVKQHWQNWDLFYYSHLSSCRGCGGIFTIAWDSQTKQYVLWTQNRDLPYKARSKPREAWLNPFSSQGNYSDFFSFYATCLIWT